MNYLGVIELIHAEITPAFVSVDYASRVCHWQSHVARWRWSALDVVELIAFHYSSLSLIHR